jgi:hypothetical protein
VKARGDAKTGREIQRLKNLIAYQAEQLALLRKPPAPEPPKKPTPVDGVVYYLRVGSYIKIGWASDLAKRMRAYPPDSVLLATEPGTRKDETRRHRMFAAHRTHGREWYAMVPSLLHHIDMLKERHGQPNAVAFAARPVEVPRPYATKKPVGDARFPRMVS